MRSKLEEIELSVEVASDIRHKISSGLAFVETSVQNLAGQKPDIARALRLHSLGTQKFKNILSLLDESHNEPEAEPTAIGYNTTKERIFTSTHPEVIHWTLFFKNRVDDLRIFDSFERVYPRGSVARAVIVGTQWYRFSSFMPWFLCQAAAMVSDNEKRHYIIQTAFEELGMRDVAEIHPELFWQAAMVAGVSEADRERLKSAAPVSSDLDKLKNDLIAANSDAMVLGLLLGLEIPARENIETIFSSLAINPVLEMKLAQHIFFKLHRKIEIEHVRLTVANFLRFCKTEIEREEFIKGFDAGVDFWRRFWDGIGMMIEAEKGLSL